MKSRGYTIVLDALMALVLTVAILGAVYSIYYPQISSTPEASFKRLHYVSEDVLDVLNKQGILDQIGEEWAEANHNTSSLHWINASNISREYLEQLMPEGIGYELTIDDTVVYNTDSDPNSSRIMRGDAVSETHATRVLVGYSAGLPTLGYVARAFLTNIKEKTTSSYAYYGGFVGQGNLTRILDLPDSMDTIDEVYMELAAGDNFNLSINGNPCSNPHTVSETGSMNANIKEYITSCKNYFTTGENEIRIVFNNGDLSSQYIGGGFIRVTYNTSDIGGVEDTGVGYYYFPGIEGLINLYSAIYVPGALNSMSAHLSLYNNYSTYFAIGDTRVFSSQGINETQEINLTDSEIKSMFGGAYPSSFSRNTVPIRLSAENITVSPGSGYADVVLITDLSGSMQWRLDSNVYTSKVITDCSNPQVYEPDTRRVSLAKCLDKQFVDIVLNASGNRLGLVSFTTSSGIYHDLSNDHDSLIDHINDYSNSPSGGTCVCCAINKAYELLAGASQSITLLSRQSTWSFNDSYRDSTPPDDGEGDHWIELDFDDSDWSIGTAPNMLGAGGGGSGTRVGVMGDYNNQLMDLLEERGYTVTQYGRGDYSDIINDLDNLDVVVLHRVNNHWRFDNLLSEADAKQKGLVFASAYPYWSYGLGVLQSRTGDPSYVTHNWNQGPVQVEVLADHSIFDGYSTGQAVTLISGGDNDYQTYTSYSGTNIGESNMPSGYQYMMGYQVTGGGARHALLGSLGATGWTDVNDWTSDGENIFDNAVRWAAGISGGNLSGYFYLRKNFTVADPAAITEATLYVYSDDRAEIYLNGVLVDNDTEIHDGTYWNREVSINPLDLVAGENIIAVKLVNNDNVSAKFDAELKIKTGNRRAFIVVMTDGITGYHCNNCGAGCSGTCDSTSGSYDCGGNPSDCWGSQCDTAIQDAVCASCRAHEDLDAAVYAIGFGPISTDCPNANTTMQGIAACGNRSYYASSNATELEEIYQDIAQEIVNTTYQAQIINVTGGLSESILYPESYIQYYYTPTEYTGYGEVSITYDTERFNNTIDCEGVFYVPADVNVVDSKVTSYSAEHWSDYLSIINSNGSQIVYTLRDQHFGGDYTILGDPYILQIPPEYVKSGENNTVTIGTGDDPGTHTNCSADNRAIYTVMVERFSSYEDVYARREGCNWVIEAKDGTTLEASIPDTYNGSKNCTYQPPWPTGIVYDGNDSVDDAVYRLMDRIDLDNDGRIDIKFDPNMLNIELARAGGVRSLWGPIRVKLVTWM